MPGPETEEMMMKFRCSPKETSDGLTTTGWNKTTGNVSGQKIIKVFEKRYRKQKSILTIFLYLQLYSNFKLIFTQEPTKKDNYVYNILREKLNVHNIVENFRKIAA